MARQAHHVRFDKFTMIIKSRITLSLSKGDKLTMIILSLSKDGHAFYK